VTHEGSEIACQHEKNFKMLQNFSKAVEDRYDIRQMSANIQEAYADGKMPL
jgi:hypothetical protein